MPSSRRQASGGGEVPDPDALTESLVALMGAQQEQSARMARLLHDDVNQVLSAAGLHLDLLRMEFEKSSPGIAEKTAEIQQLLGQAIEQLREISYELNPAVVERVGLPFALERLVGRMRRHRQVNVRARIDPKVRVELPVASAIYRIAEAALDNAARHAGAEQVELILSGNGANAKLEIRDDGRGFNRETVRPGLGLLSMKHYATRIGCVLEIDSETGRGTIVTVRMEHPGG